MSLLGGASQYRPPCWASSAQIQRILLIVTHWFKNWFCYRDTISLPWDVIETHLYQSKQQCKVNIVEPLLWDTSFQEKPPFMGHKIWSWKNVLILIFVPVTHDMKGHFCSRKSDTFPRSPNLGLTSIQVQWNTALWPLHYYGQFFSA